MNKQIQKAAEVLNNGGIIIFPTDTAYGIGCRIDNKEAIEKLFKIRNRPANQPTPVLISDLEMAKKYLKEIPKNVEDQLMNKFWPGGLTVILESKLSHVPVLVRGGKKSLGVRIPDHKDVRTLIKLVGVPILGPSANFHGDVTPYKLKDVSKELVGLVDYVLEGECFLNEPSTVIDCTKNPWRVLRMGAVNINI